MSWTVQIPSMCSSPNIIVNKKTKSKNQFTKTIRSKTNKYQKRKKIETLYRRRFWKKQKNNIITIIHQCYKIKHFSRHLRNKKIPWLKSCPLCPTPKKIYTGYQHILWYVKQLLKTDRQRKIKMHKNRKKRELKFCILKLHIND